MGKFNPNTQKLATIVQYFQASRVAHNIKELEKQLPGVASINGMQVKDYLQALSDENKIHVEKIGSGNWYWSFASEDKLTRKKALEGARSAHSEAASALKESQLKIAELNAQLQEDSATAGGSNARDALIATRTKLECEVNVLHQELVTYSDADPTELARRRNEINLFKTEAERFTDEIYSMERWFAGMSQDDDGMKALRGCLYGEELDEESAMLKEL